MHKTYILTDNTHSKIVDRIASVLPQTDHPVVMTPMKYMFENEDAANFALLILIVDSLDTQTLTSFRSSSPSCACTIIPWVCLLIKK